MKVEIFKRKGSVMGALSVFGVGVATADPELRFVGENKTALATVNLAFNRSYKKDEKFVQEASFLKVSVWGKRAERFAELVAKGKPVYVNGYVRQENWNSDEGQKRSAITLVLTEWQLVEKFANGSGSGKNTTESATSNAQTPAQEPVAANAGGDDEVPF